MLIKNFRFEASDNQIVILTEDVRRKTAGGEEELIESKIFFPLEYDESNKEFKQVPPFYLNKSNSSYNDIKKDLDTYDIKYQEINSNVISVLPHDLADKNVDIYKFNDSSNDLAGYIRHRNSEISLSKFGRSFVSRYVDVMALKYNLDKNEVKIRITSPYDIKKNVFYVNYTCMFCNLSYNAGISINEYIDVTRYKIEETEKNADSINVTYNISGTAYIEGDTENLPITVTITNYFGEYETKTIQQNEQFNLVFKNKGSMEFSADNCMPVVLDNKTIKKDISDIEITLYKLYNYTINISGDDTIEKCTRANDPYEAYISVVKKLDNGSYTFYKSPTKIDGASLRNPFIQPIPHGYKIQIGIVKVVSTTATDNAAFMASGIPKSTVEGVSYCCSETITSPGDTIYLKLPYITTGDAANIATPTIYDSSTNALELREGGSRGNGEVVGNVKWSLSRNNFSYIVNNAIEFTKHTSGETLKIIGVYYDNTGNEKGFTNKLVNVECDEEDSYTLSYLINGQNVFTVPIYAPYVETDYYFTGLIGKEYPLKETAYETKRCSIHVNIEESLLSGGWTPEEFEDIGFTGPNTSSQDKIYTSKNSGLPESTYPYFIQRWLLPDETNPEVTIDTGVDIKYTIVHKSKEVKGEPTYFILIEQVEYNDINSGVVTLSRAKVHQENYIYMYTSGGEVVETDMFYDMKSGYFTELPPNEQFIDASVMSLPAYVTTFKIYYSVYKVTEYNSGPKKIEKYSATKTKLFNSSIIDDLITKNDSDENQTLEIDHEYFDSKLRVVLNDTILRRKRRIISGVSYYEIVSDDANGFIKTLPGGETGTLSINWHGVQYEKYDTGSPGQKTNSSTLTVSHTFTDPNTSTNNITIEDVIYYPDEHSTNYVTQVVTFIHQGSSLINYEARVVNVQALTSEITLLSGETISNFNDRQPEDGFLISYEVQYRAVYTTWSEEWHTFSTYQKQLSVKVEDSSSGESSPYTKAIVIGKNVYPDVNGVIIMDTSNEEKTDYTVYTIPKDNVFNSQNGPIQLEENISVLGYTSKLTYTLPQLKIRVPISGGGNTPDPSTGS